MSDPISQDEALRRAQKLKRNTESLQRDARKAANDRGVMAWWRAKGSAIGSAVGFLGPVGRFIGSIARLIARFARWSAISPGTDEHLGGFSWRRLAVVGTASLVTLIALHVLLSAAYYYSTYFHETVYVTGKQEIETGEKYQLGGCTSLPCSTASDNGKFYLVESSLYFPTLIYPEEDVFANIPQQNAACEVEGYGLYFRTLRWLYKSAQLYQHITKVSCRPYSDDEVERSVNDGEIHYQPTGNPSN